MNEEKLNFVSDTALATDYVVHMGDDWTAVNSARISRGKETDGLSGMEEKDIKLIEFLANHGHMTPFEHQVLSVIIHCPLYIRSQIHRHRTFSYNEISRRYTSDDVVFYIPKVFNYQDKKNKQGGAEEFDQDFNRRFGKRLRDNCTEAYYAYLTFLNQGMAREQARAILPQNLMTKFYMTGNLRNWAHFLKLRLDSHAQRESQYIAKQVESIIQNIWPITYKALKESNNA